MKLVKYLIKRIMLLCLILVSCNSTEIREQDIVGVWIEDDTRCESESSNCTIFEFQEDGQFEARNIPSKYFGYAYSIYSKDILFNATGVWTFEITEDPLEDDEIRLHFDPVSELGHPSYNSLLYVSGRSGGLNIFQWFGDESESIYFVKISTVENAK